MPYRNILVALDGGHTSRAHANAAARHATLHGARLTGAFLMSERMPGLYDSEGLVPPVIAHDSFTAEREERRRTASDNARQVFDVAASEASVSSCEWRIVDGDADASIIAHARRADLVLTPRTLHPAFANTMIHAESVGMACGGPILVLPDLAFQRDFGRKILVAWKECREAIRVLRDGWPLLAAAEEVHFVTAARDGARVLDDLLLRQLADHGCRTASLRIDRDTDRPVGDILQTQAGLVGADMIMMGLFGRSRISEFVLGGASRSMLDGARLPLFLSH
jgi:nucleotide-binding universal stress UspA family protein